MQTCSQENPRVKTNWGMGSKALKKKKKSVLKLKGMKNIHSNQNWKNTNMDTLHCFSILIIACYTNVQE